MSINSNKEEDKYKEIIVFLFSNFNFNYEEERKIDEKEYLKNKKKKMLLKYLQCKIQREDWNSIIREAYENYKRRKKEHAT